ncbi:MULTISPECIES: hypothetical protein [unclassified Pseudoalteromonas]|uniref:hypothetical protein n=1 Tax=unclassified Pseudoalteromonas TaxID=194690 RepID=UPI00390CA324|nr:hypothetical protein [Ningiella sp. W23]
MILYLYDENDVFAGTYTYKQGGALPKLRYTTIAPPKPADNEMAVFKSGEWQLEERTVETPLIPVVIDNVAGQLDDYVNIENEYTVPQSSDAVIATGQLAIPDRKFKVPFKRVDTGRVQLMPAEVVGGVFTLPLKFETNGVWIVNQALINSDYEQDIFALTERRFSVI